jgi:hypothetical protein
MHLLAERMLAVKWGEVVTERTPAPFPSSGNASGSSVSATVTQSFAWLFPRGDLGRTKWVSDVGMAFPVSAKHVRRFFALEYLRPYKERMYDWHESEVEEIISARLVRLQTDSPNYSGLLYHPFTNTIFADHDKKIIICGVKGEMLVSEDNDPLLRADNGGNKEHVHAY